MAQQRQQAYQGPALRDMTIAVAGMAATVVLVHSIEPRLSLLLVLLLGALVVAAATSLNGRR